MKFASQASLSLGFWISWFILLFKPVLKDKKAGDGTLLSNVNQMDPRYSPGLCTPAWLPGCFQMPLEIYSKALNYLGLRSLTYSPPKANLPTNFKISLCITRHFFSCFFAPRSDSPIPQVESASLQCSAHLDPASYLKIFPVLTDLVCVSFLELACTFYDTIQFFSVLFISYIWATLCNQIVNHLWPASHVIFLFSPQCIKQTMVILVIIRFMSKCQTHLEFTLLKYAQQDILVHWNSYLTNCQMTRFLIIHDYWKSHIIFLCFIFLYTKWIYYTYTFLLPGFK